MEALLWLACVVLCAIAFRIRGGLLAGTRYAPPGQVSRLIFAAAAGLTAWTGVPWWAALATVPMWWVSSTFPLFDAIDLGRNEGTFWGDAALLFARGLLWTGLPALVLFWLGAHRPWALLVAGATMPLCYWLGRQSGSRLWGAGALDWCQTGEAIYGAALGLGVLAAVA